MHPVTSSSQSQASIHQGFSQGRVYMPVTGHAVACPLVDTYVHVHGAVASATEKTPSTVPVQTHRKSASAEGVEPAPDKESRDSRRIRFDLKKQAGLLYTKHVSVYKNPFDQCMSNALGYVAGGAKATHATIVHNKSEGHAYVKNLYHCNNAWACPVCSERASREREAEILQLEAFCNDKGYFMAMATLTVHHEKKDKLHVLTGDILSSVRAFWSGRWAKQFKKVWGFVGHVRAFEVTYSDKNGFHPHIHYLLILKNRPSQAQMETLQDVFFKRWQEICQKQDLDTSPAGFCLEEAERGTYLSKWGVSAELTKHHKKIRGQTMNMWALLESSKENEAHGKKWLEFYGSMKGRAQIMWSPGLKKLVEEWGQQQPQPEPIEPAQLDEVDVPERLIKPLLTLYGGSWLDVIEDVEKRGLDPIKKWLTSQYDAEEARASEWDDDVDWF